MRSSSDKTPWGCQNGLQVLKTMDAMHIALLYGESAAIKRQQVRKDVRKVPEHGVRLLLDLTGACSREQVCQIASDCSVFSGHAMAQDRGNGAGHTQTHRAWQEGSTPCNQAVECWSVIGMSIPPWRRVGDACLRNCRAGIRCMLYYQSSACYLSRVASVLTREGF